MRGWGKDIPFFLVFFESLCEKGGFFFAKEDVAKGRCLFN